MLHPTSTVLVTNISVVVAEYLRKIQRTFNTMSYSDLINILIISASRSFVDKLEDQKAHECVKDLNKNFTIVPNFNNKFQRTVFNSANMET